MVSIQTGRLIIRNFFAEDWKALQDIIVDKEASEFAIYDYQFPTSEQEIQEIIRWFADGSNYLAVYETVNRRIIGFVSLNGTAPGETDMGFCIYSPFQRKGYATEACTAVIGYAFSVLGLERITSGTANKNYPSYNLLNKLGFKKTHEGIASFRKTPDGTPIDFTGSLFLLEKRDWLIKYPSPELFPWQKP
ncbi:GNAT family N-acetyltransferase [Ruminiclostridium cellobioparum]|uniref:GCN5-related N-acetyltransferase n=1 Tax=Ruminiclostridium cellobioparum subsp. termitidis CT1112 TaxID=1195236 RepID=S0FRS6_RUMCE|nr:GNAT family N-acetyltransferase [Ruminiclostridium cellobioparum]EMS73056.1 GCN5-related N-acetyltransferase [Ruminiclostridium cellobioparum subsp. termitidis CT1112]